MLRSGASLRDHWRFVLLEPEPDNYTYPIANEDGLVQWVSEVAACDAAEAAKNVAEPSRDRVLSERLLRATEGHWLWTKRSPDFGKRLGWYALARALKPKLVIEVGVHDGLGSLLLLRAVERNGTEGHPGRLVSFDVNPAAGWLVRSHPAWDLKFESSSEGLPRLLSEINLVDLCIYDGWHSYQAERTDFERIVQHLGPNGVLLSDDAQVTNALAETATAHDLDYFAFQEIPVDHFYPGAVLGAARSRRT